MCIVIVLPRAVVCIPRDGTTITCTGQFLSGTMTVIVAILPYSG